jgi:hypothetical protein
MIGGAIELTEHNFMTTAEPVDVNKVTDSIWRIISGGIEPRITKTENLHRLVDRLEDVANRLDST